MDSLTEAIDPTAMRASARVGTTLRGKWHVDALLGIGGMAAVYAATHRNGARAAIKILHPELCLHADVRARFFREGRVANTVNHDGAVKVLDEDEDNGSIYLVMELLDGESLESRASRAGGTLPVDEVLAATDQLLDVLIAAHAKGVIHRDLKPENVFLTRDGAIKILDFGIARLRAMSTQSHATRDGSTMGTPAFMAPEQARGVWDEVDARADIWAVGATMFTLITGRSVHEGRTTNEILVAAITQNAPPVASVLPGVPKAVAAVIDKALAFEKDARWADAAAMQNAVRHAFHAMHGAPISTHPKLTVPENVPNRTLVSAGVAVPEVGQVGTGPAVVSGQTGVPLRRSTGLGIPRPALIAGAIVAAGMVLAIMIVTIALVSRTAPVAPSSSTQPVAAALPPGRDAGSDAAPSEPSEKPPNVISVDDLPPATQPKKTTPPLPKPLPVPPATSWKDQRK